MPPQRPPINHEVLQWAVAESGYPAADIAAHLKIDGAEFESWLAGVGGPTRGQFTKLANKLRRPKSIFFLPEPPEANALPPNLRRAVGRTQRDLAADELLQVRRARRLQRLLSLLARDRQDSPVVMPALSASEDPVAAGTSLRRWLGVTIEEQLGWASPGEAFGSWREAAERGGVVVMQLRLGSGGLRGFALAGEYAPLAAVNTRENVQARIFTLLHELAHLASATQAACLESARDAEHVERWCDEASSAAVLPRDALRRAVAELGRTAGPDLELVRTIAARFSVSLRATAVALIRAELADDWLYGEVEQGAPTGDYDKGFARGGGQRAPRLRLREVGPRAARVVLSAMDGDRLSELEARRYLRLDGTELAELAAEISGAP